ncbi:MAG: STAS domain-containing protein [Phycisphaerales bacterium]
MRIEIGLDPQAESDQPHPADTIEQSVRKVTGPNTALLHISQTQGVYRASLRCGSLRTLDSGKLRAELVALHQPNTPPGIVFSMTGMETLASGCLGTIAQLSADLQQIGGCLVLYNIPKEIHKILKKTKLDRVVPTTRNRPQAIKKAHSIQRKLADTSRSAA